MVNHRSLFIYYRVETDKVVQARQAVEGVQCSLQRSVPGLQVRLMRRSDCMQAGLTSQTWMEVYEHPQGIDPAWMQLLQEQIDCLPAGLLGERHCETFEDMPALEFDAPR
ncbi:MAG: DUF4936 family protein [Aquabacterium sp.]|uniref:DUF4936 family protein n=1 Tax=Aquabacterium sp. TaxID=1872578 RepID=UPI003BC4E591